MKKYLARRRMGETPAITVERVPEDRIGHYLVETCADIALAGIRKKAAHLMAFPTQSYVMVIAVVPDGSFALTLVRGGDVMSRANIAREFYMNVVQELKSRIGKRPLFTDLEV